MEMARKLGALEEEVLDRQEIYRHSRHVSSSSCGQKDWRSAPSSREDVLNTTPRLSYCSNSNAAELVKEIATLEVEIAHLERYLLSLYRTAFGQHLAESPSSAQASSLDSRCHTGLSLKDDQSQIGCPQKQVDLLALAADNGPKDSGTNRPLSHGIDKEKTDNNSRFKDNSPSHGLAGSVSALLQRVNSKKNTVRSAPHHPKLADHLCASIRDDIFGTPCKLSEDIVKCIAAVYCKLNNNIITQTDSQSSPISSLSSSSTFSPQDQSDNWSPRCQYDVTASPYMIDELKGKHGPYSGMIEITRICIDKDRFKCAAALLEGHRILVRRLQDIDPSKLEHEEKLAFWINIHNAMVMHAFIAYGLENNHIRSTPSVLKKSYNVGGQSFNAYEIQSSIFGCYPHRPEAGLRSFLPPTRKFSTVTSKHAYALDFPEPLVHFALCLGAYSDPAVRVYTAKKVTEQLQVAKKEFIHANFFIHNRTRIMLPKILEFYAKDASLDLFAVLDIVHDCLPENQQRDLRQCIKRKLDKCIQWSSYKPTFKYILQRDLDSFK